MGAEIGLAVSVGVVFLLGFIVVSKILDGRRAEAQRRLAAESPENSAVLLSQQNLIGNEKAGAIAQLDEGFKTMVTRSGLDVTPEQVLAFMSLLGVILAAVLFFWKGMLWLSAIGLVVGLMIPVLIFAFLQSQYRRKMQQQLPDTYFMIARTLRAGLSLEQSFEMVGDRSLKPLSDEFKIISNQIKLGLSIPMALQNAAKRIRLLDFDVFVSTISLYYAIGGNLPMLIDRLALQARDHNQFRGQFLAATAQGRITAIFVASVAPVLLLAYAILEPDHIQAFFRSSTGWSILIGCAILQIIGTFWLYRLLKIDY